MSVTPDWVKRSVWYLTDAEWRREYLGHKKIIRERERKQAKAWSKLFPQTNGEVIAGPFQGLKFPESFCSVQKILGTYEMELHHCFEVIRTKSYDLIVDIGAAEGFFVAGLAKLFPETSVIAFEAVPQLHPKVLELAKFNGCSDRVALKGLCGPEDLLETIVSTKHPFILCDIEGAEYEVLDPEQTPDLSKADILVEVHDHLRDGVGDLLVQRFQNSHDIEVIYSVDREFADFPTDLELDDELKSAAMDEARHSGSKWYFMQAKR